jgi:hypothetical protein
MARVDTKFLDIDGSVSDDVAGYIVYLAEDGTALDYESLSFDVGTQTESINLNDLFGPIEGKYSVGVSAYDQAGNESDITPIVSDFFFDSVPPAAPLGGEVY